MQKTFIGPHQKLKRSPLFFKDAGSKSKTSQTASQPNSDLPDNSTASFAREDLFKNNVSFERSIFKGAETAREANKFRSLPAVQKRPYLQDRQANARDTGTPMESVHDRRCKDDPES